VLRNVRIMAMSEDQVQYQITDGVLARTVGNTVVLFHPETERLLTLNGCGTRIWELLTEEPDTAPLLARLTGEFDGPEPQIRQQALQFLAELEAEQIIRREGLEPVRKAAPPLLRG
jgi:hypothetical protein